jgi:hypothetical protein
MADPYESQDVNSAVAFPERPVGLAVMTLLVAMPYFINAGSSFVYVASKSPDYFIVFVTPPLFALIFAFLAASWWHPLPSRRPAAAALNVVLRTGVIVVGSLVCGFVLAYVLGAVWGLITDPARTLLFLRTASAADHVQTIAGRIGQAFTEGGWGVLAAIIGARAIRAFVWPLGPPDPADPGG